MTAIGIVDCLQSVAELSRHPEKSSGMAVVALLRGNRCDFYLLREAGTTATLKF
jgi:hypothetical protein